MPVAKAAIKPGSLADLMAKSEKTYNLTVGPVNQIAQPVKTISTGNIAIDHITGVNGFPLGRSIELSGPPSSGKTTTAIQTAAILQQIIIAGGSPELGIKATDHILYMDYEQTLDEEYCKMLGLDVNHDSFLLSQPDTLEDGANFSREAIKTGEIRMIIWDSVAAMQPSAKAEAEIGKALPAVRAKLLTDFGEQLNPLLYQHEVLNVWINHLKETLEMGGRPGVKRYSTPGGVTLKFFASMRLEFKQIEQIREKVLDQITQEMVEEVTAQTVNVKVTKNKVGPPFRRANVRVRFGRGFDNFWTAMMVLVSHKKIVVAAKDYKFHRLEEFGLVPEWMPRLKTGTMQPHIKGDKSLFMAADKFPEWRQQIIDYAAKVLADSTSGVVDDEDESDEELDALLPEENS